MGQVFLGKRLHWALIIALIVVGWELGHERLHVIWFNLFTAILLLVSAAAVLTVILTSKPGERITRDPMAEDED